MKVRYDDLNNMSSKENSAASVDVEQKALDDSQLQNTTIKHFAWQDVTVTVKDRTSKDQKTILDRVSGVVKAGRSPYCIVLALLTGPRRDSSLDGPQWLWKNDPIECSCSP